MHLLLPLAVLLTLLGLSGGALYIWTNTPPALIPAGSFIVAFAGLLAITSFVYAWAKKERILSIQNLSHPSVWILGLIIIFLSGWLCRPYNFFQGPWFRSYIVGGVAIAFGLTFISWRRALLLLPIIASALSISTFLHESNGSLLFADDHAVFLFRLKLLKENFPWIPFWSPLWNAGFESRDFFATGALNAFILFSPLIYLFEVESVYNIIIALILWGLAPLCSYLAARKLAESRVVAATTATLAMTTSLFWYRWALKYGTVGFVVSTSLLPLVFALGLQFIRQDKLRKRDALLFIVTCSLMLMWSPSGLALLPLVIIAAPRIPAILRSKRHLLTLALIIALNLSWMTMMWKVSSIGKFLNSESAASTAQVASSQKSTNSSNQHSAFSGTAYRHRAGGLDLKKALKNWQESANAANPLLIILALPALLTLSPSIRVPFALMSVWLVALGTFGVSLKPQLELDRMLVIAGSVISLPVAAFIVSLFQRASRGILERTTASVAAGFLLASPLATYHMLRNDLYDKYSFATPETRRLAESISSAARGGRGLFTGNVLHQLDGGHVAPLPLWSDTPLIASSYCHNIWRYEQPIPSSFLSQGDAGIERYMDLMNISLVTAHEPNWRKYLSERPAKYTEIGRYSGFVLYSRNNVTPSYAIEGSLKNISYSTNSVTLTPLSPRVVLSYKYNPFLQSTGCRIQAFQAAPEMQLLELTDCPVGEPITIKSISPLKRLFG